jgi:hypothetical protein
MDGGQKTASDPDRLTPGNRCPKYPLNRRLGTPQSRSASFVAGKQGEQLHITKLMQQWHKEKHVFKKRVKENVLTAMSNSKSQGEITALSSSSGVFLS